MCAALRIGLVVILVQICTIAAIQSLADTVQRLDDHDDAYLVHELGSPANKGASGCRTITFKTAAGKYDGTPDVKISTGGSQQALPEGCTARGASCAMEVCNEELDVTVGKDGWRFSAFQGGKEISGSTWVKNGEKRIPFANTEGKEDEKANDQSEESSPDKDATDKSEAQNNAGKQQPPAKDATKKSKAKNKEGKKQPQGANAQQPNPQASGEPEPVVDPNSGAGAEEAPQSKVDATSGSDTDEQDKSAKADESAKAEADESSTAPSPPPAKASKIPDVVPADAAEVPQVNVDGKDTDTNSGSGKKASGDSAKTGGAVAQSGKASTKDGAESADSGPGAPIPELKKASPPQPSAPPPPEPANNQGDATIGQKIDKVMSLNGVDSRWRPAPAPAPVDKSKSKSSSKSSSPESSASESNDDTKKGAGKKQSDWKQYKTPDSKTFHRNERTGHVQWNEPTAEQQEQSEKEKTAADQAKEADKGSSKKDDANQDKKADKDSSQDKDDANQGKKAGKGSSEKAAADQAKEDKGSAAEKGAVKEADKDSSEAKESAQEGIQALQDGTGTKGSSTKGADKRPEGTTP